MDVIALLCRRLEKKNCKIEIRKPNANAIHSTRIDTQILSSLKSAVNMKSRPTVFAKQ